MHFHLQILIFCFFFFCFNRINGQNSQEYCGTNGWAIWRQNCYKIFTAPNSTNFDHAEKICQNSASHAASVHNEEENKFIANLADEHFELMKLNLPEYGQTQSWHTIFGGIYIGYHRIQLASSQTFKAFNEDETPMNYAIQPKNADMGKNKNPYSEYGYPWVVNNPSGFWMDPSLGKREECLEILNWGGQKGLWNDIGCSWTLSGVVCKKPLKCQ